MFCFNTKKANRIFGLKPEFSSQEPALLMAKNQGLYNGFLAVGLLWANFSPPPVCFDLAVFFCGCVVLAAIFGAITIHSRILVVQGFPAFMALVFIVLGM